MHEMALTEGIVEIAVEAAGREGARRVRRIIINIGALSHVQPEALSFCFSAVSAGTIAEGATLEIVGAPGEGWCMDCAKTVPLPERYGPCPECGGVHVQMTAGDAMRVTAIEVD